MSFTRRTWTILAIPLAFAAMNNRELVAQSGTSSAISGTVTIALYNDLAQFTFGAAYAESATFPVSMKERIAEGNVDVYTMDTYKPSTHLILTEGMRVTWNADPVNLQHLFARPAGWFLDLLHGVEQALDQATETRLRSLFPSTPLLIWQPHVSAATALRA